MPLSGLSLKTGTVTTAAVFLTRCWFWVLLGPSVGSFRIFHVTGFEPLSGLRSVKTTLSKPKCCPQRSGSCTRSLDRGPTQHEKHLRNVELAMSGGARL